MMQRLSCLFYGFLKIAANAQRLGLGMIRVAILIIFVWIGGLKFRNYEAEGIVPFVANSPFMSFLYNEKAPEYRDYKLKEGEYDAAKHAWHEKNNTYGFSHGLGLLIMGIGILTFLGFFSARIGLAGELLAVIMTLGTLSFLVTTPEVWVPDLGSGEYGFPLLSGAGRLVIKDIAILAGAVVLVLLGAKGCLAAGITLPGVGYVDLGIAAPLLWEGLLVALAECARIADGMDGIVCGTSFAAMLGLMGVMTLLGWFPLGVLPAALAGSLMAFLLWNFPPAKLRLGSVGSLFLAGMLGCVPLCIGWPDLTLPLALPFWLEGGMVALQILVCKASRGRRQLFRSAPLHRWLELRGQSAEQIFYTFCVIAMLGVALTVQLAKIS